MRIELREEWNDLGQRGQLLSWGGSRESKNLAGAQESKQRSLKLFCKVYLTFKYIYLIGILSKMSGLLTLQREALALSKWTYTTLLGINNPIA